LKYRILFFCPCVLSLILSLTSFARGDFSDNNLSNISLGENFSNLEILGCLDKGCNFLLEKQNTDGSWGSARQTKGLNIFAPVPGSHRAFRLAVTALSISALLEIKSNDQNFTECINKGQNYLLERLPQLRRASPMALYNVWSHCYGLQALHRMHEKSPQIKERKKIREVMEQQIKMLQTYESIDGGWGYYDFNAQTKQPSGSSISFVNATGLVALKDANKSGVSVPSRLVNRALAALKRQRLPDHSFLYGEYLKYRPRSAINRPAGSLGRSHACNYALQIWGDESVTDEVHKICLDRLIERNGWLDVARKRPVPHESWFAVAGYFFYYGHLYAAFCTENLSMVDQPKYQNALSKILIPLQEKDGSWWDFPFYDYHQQYGTAMALLSLKRCLPQ